MRKLRTYLTKMDGSPSEFYYMEGQIKRAWSNLNSLMSIIPPMDAKHVSGRKVRLRSLPVDFDMPIELPDDYIIEPKSSEKMPILRNIEFYRFMEKQNYQMRYENTENGDIKVLLIGQKYGDVWQVGNRLSEDFGAHFLATDGDDRPLIDYEYLFTVENKNGYYKLVLVEKKLLELNEQMIKFQIAWVKEANWMIESFNQCEDKREIL